MAYWWVYQGESFDRALKGGYLWAPQATRAGGNPFYYWSNVLRVGVGDMIFSHRAGQIVAVCMPRGPAYDAPAPDPADINNWVATGWRLDVAYTTLRTPIPYGSAYEAIKDLPEGQESPFASNGRPNQGFLFRLSDAAGERLCQLVVGDTNSPIEAKLEVVTGAVADPAATSALAMIIVRMGQGAFRRKLDQHWSEKCAVTGLAVRELLRASHIKRWMDSDDHQRLDVCNGLLLSAAYDAAFDKGLVTFEDDGAIRISPKLGTDAAVLAGIDPVARVIGLLPGHRTYLAYHRDTYFNR